MPLLLPNTLPWCCCLWAALLVLSMDVAFFSQAAAGRMHPDRGVSLRFPRYIQTRDDKVRIGAYIRSCEHFLGRCLDSNKQKVLCGG